MYNKGYGKLLQAMNQEEFFMNQWDQKTVNAIRVLSAEAIQKANSGHPGASVGRGAGCLYVVAVSA